MKPLEILDHTQAAPNQRFGLDELAKILARNLHSQSHTFAFRDQMAECYLGGSFIPDIGEMRLFSSYNTSESGDNFRYNLGDTVLVARGENFQYKNAAARCYYEYIRRATNINYILCRLEAVGVIEVAVIARNNRLEKTVLQRILNFGSGFGEMELPLLDVVNLPANGSLLLRIRSVSTKSAVRKFSWLGLVPASVANMGERVYLIRTYGARQAVINSLRTITGKIARVRPEVLQRSLFIIYDAAGKATDASGADFLAARIIEIAGPNCGGGGNASLLMSLLLRLPESSAKNVSELVIMDDDARIDPETILRHDGFITARKDNIISSSVVYMSEKPTVLQEYGGIWGKFFSRRNHSIRVNPHEPDRTMFPYLPRNSRDMSDERDRSYLGVNQEVDYATFIFISFPYALALKIGVSFPFFLRNDDVEICLRAAAKGGRVMINPNLHAWHAARHKIVSEFYAFLHSMIVNAAYDWLSEEYFYETVMARIASIARVGNAALLYATMLSLQKFSQGSEWLVPERIFNDYLDCATQIRSFIAKCVRTIPFEVFDVNRERVQLVCMVDIWPQVPGQEEIVFFDPEESAYFSQDKAVCEPSMAQMLRECVRALNRISGNFTELNAAWKHCLHDFDHLAFWDNFFRGKSLELRWLNMDCANTREERPEDDITGVFDVSQAKLEMENILPPDFSEDGYLQRNPDVAQAGVGAREHWLKYGHREGRKYK